MAGYFEPQLSAAERGVKGPVGSHAGLLLKCSARPKWLTAAQSFARKTVTCCCQGKELSHCGRDSPAAAAEKRVLRKIRLNGTLVGKFARDWQQRRPGIFPRAQEANKSLKEKNSKRKCSSKECTHGRPHCLRQTPSGQQLQQFGKGAARAAWANGLHLAL